MLKRDITQLAVYEINEETESIPLVNLYNLYLTRTSEIIYIVRHNRLYGIICMGEVFCQNYCGEIKINRYFTTVTGFSIYKAYEIFKRNKKINKIPVVNEHGELIGDYSRWDDLLFIERNNMRDMNKEVVKKIVEPYEAVYVAEPVYDKDPNYIGLIKKLKEFHIEYKLLKKQFIGKKLLQNALCIFLTEDEKRGTQCLYANDFLEFESKNIRWSIKMVTYTKLLSQIMREDQIKKLKMRKSDEIDDYILDEKATLLLSEFQKKGIKCFYFWQYEDKNGLSEYQKEFREKVKQNIQKFPISFKEPWPKKEQNEEFYDELYEFEDYASYKAQKEIFIGTHTFEYKKDITGKYFNARNGIRRTCFQPKQYIGTIYLLGLCTALGGYVEDQYTIASYLQKKLLEKGYLYRVENYGVELRLDFEIDFRLEEIGEYCKNDIIICLSGHRAANLQGVSLEKIFDTYQVATTCVTDAYGHCNHKANYWIAEGMLTEIEPYLLKKEKEGISEKFFVNIHEFMYDYIKNKYLVQYFDMNLLENYNSVGSIVINGNPLHSGHLYLIERAKQCVDYLIIFVIEENSFLFSFEERMKMIKKATDHLENIIIVPNGDFIFSKNNFWEYYRKREDEVVSFNAQYDINVFINYIAKPLHITHRFVGEENENKIIKIYNNEMKSILPDIGIEYIEIPKLFLNNDIISSSKIRKLLRKEEYDKAFAMMPEVVNQFLKKRL